MIAEHFGPMDLGHLCTQLMKVNGTETSCNQVVITLIQSR